MQEIRSILIALPPRDPKLNTTVKSAQHLGKDKSRTRKVTSILWALFFCFYSFLLCRLFAISGLRVGFVIRFVIKVDWILSPGIRMYWCF